MSRHGQRPGARWQRATPARLLRVAPCSTSASSSPCATPRRGYWAIVTGAWRSLADGTCGADRQRLMQAILQLADNAVRHTERGDMRSPSAQTSTRAARFWVRDTGEGVPRPEQRASSGVSIAPQRVASRRSGTGPRPVDRPGHRRGARWQSHARQPSRGQGATFTLVIPRSIARNDRRTGVEPDPDRRGRGRIASFVEKGLRARGMTTSVADQRRRALQTWP